MREKLLAALYAAAKENLLQLGLEGESFEDVADILVDFMGEPSPQAPVQAPLDVEKDPEQELARAFYKKFYHAKNNLFKAIYLNDGALAAQWGEVLRALEIYKAICGGRWYLYPEE